MHFPAGSDVDFARAQLPSRGARVLEVGCGDGSLAFALAAALDRHFTERFIGWTPYLYRYRLHPALESLERALIAGAAIEATGVRYVARRRGHA